MIATLQEIGEEIIARGDNRLGFAVLLASQYIKADHSGEAQNYYKDHQELLEKYGLINILKLQKETALKRRKFKFSPFNDELLYSS